MFTLKIMNGPQAGKAISLDKTEYIIGRSKDADIIINSSQVSKKHAQINIKNNTIYIKDLGSRNGTFVNGLQTREEVITTNDKISLHDIIIMIVPSIEKNSPPQSLGALALKSDSFSQVDTNNEVESSPEEVHQNTIKHYIENIAMPGVYKLTELTDFSWLVAIFFGLLIIVSTLLSAVPALNLLKSSIEQESQRRALSIAKNMVEMNKSFILQGFHSSINLTGAQQEAGVIKALFVDNNGAIIAPSSQAGKHPDVPLLHSARKENKVSVEQLGANEIGVIIPITGYNKTTGEQRTLAHAFVQYDMSSIAINNSRTLSLYIQILFISLIIGFIFYFLIFKLFEYPIQSINKQLDRELKQNSQDISLKFFNPHIQSLIANINTSLSRTLSEDHSFEPVINTDRTNEMNSLVQMIGFPAVAFNNNLTLATFNSAAEELLSLSQEMVGFGSDKITDQALKLNIDDLLQQATFNQSETIHSQLEIGGESYELMAQAIQGNPDIAYIVITLIPQEEQV